MYSMMLMLLACAFCACSNDDEDGSGGISGSSVVGNSYRYTDIYLEGDDDYPLEAEYNVRITFTSSKECTVKTWGYDWIWYTSGYKKESFNKSETCSYTVSGEKITIKAYPFIIDRPDVVFTNCGSYLLSYGNKYIKE